MKSLWKSPKEILKDSHPIRSKTTPKQKTLLVAEDVLLWSHGMAKIIQFFNIFHMVHTIATVDGCAKSCTTWDGWNPRNNGINNGINHQNLSTGAGFRNHTIAMWLIVTFGCCSWSCSNPRVRCQQYRRDLYIYFQPTSRCSTYCCSWNSFHLVVESMDSLS